MLILIVVIPKVALAENKEINHYQITIELTNVPLSNNTLVIRKGDLNKNGKIDLSDIIELLKKYLLIEDEITQDELKIGDMNNNSQIDLSDIIILLKAYLLDEETEIIQDSYFIDSNFAYVKNHSGVIHDKEDILNFIYYTFNTGNMTINGTCSDEYTDCISDLLEILQDGHSLADVNYFLHPYNHIYNKDNSIPIGFETDNVSNFTIEIGRDNPKYSEEDIETINEFVDNLIAELITPEMSIQNKIKAIHDYIINNASYDILRIDDNPTNDDTYRSNTAYGVLFEGKGICSGYTDTMAIFLNKLGILNYQIGNESHIWNLVYIDDTWYHLDATWDDPITNIGDVLLHDFFLIDYDTLVSLDVTEHYFDKDIFVEGY